MTDLQACCRSQQKQPLLAETDRAASSEEIMSLTIYIGIYMNNPFNINIRADGFQHSHALQPRAARQSQLSR